MVVEIHDLTFDGDVGRLEGRRTVSRATLIGIGLAAAIACGGLLAVDPLAAVLVPVGLGYAFVVLERPAFGALVMAALIPVTAGLGRGLPVPGLKLSEVVVLGTALLIMAAKEGRPPIGGIDVAALGYVVLTAALVIWHPLYRGEGLGLDEIRDAFAPALFFLLYRSVRVAGLNRRQRSVALALMVSASVAAVAVAIGQRLDVGGVRQLVADLTRGEVFSTWSYLNTSVGARATGLFEVWHSFAGYLLPLLLICVAAATDEGTGRLLRVGALAMGTVVVIGLLLSQTLTVLAVAVPAVIAVAVLRGAQPRAVLVAAVLVGAGLLVAGDVVAERVNQQFGGPTNTVLGNNIDARLEIWSRDYAEPLGDFWAFGYGPGIPPGVEWQSTESSYVTLLLRGGVLLLASYLVLYLVVIDEAFYARRSGPPVDRVVADALLVLLPASLLMGLIWPYFTSSGFPHVLWIMIALLPFSRPGDRVTRAARDLDGWSPAGSRRT